MPVLYFTNVQIYSRNVCKTPESDFVLLNIKASAVPLKVKQLQLLAWEKENALPTRQEFLLDLMDLVTRWQHQTDITPIVIHCL